MSSYPYEPVKVDWKRPDIDPEILRACTKRSDLLGLAHCMGTLAIWTATGTWAYWMYASQQWMWMAVALYIHGGIFAFRSCCRTVRLDPITSFLYWHMEFHVEHHTFASIPCYRLARFHRLTRQHWDPPQSLVEAWREMNGHSRRLLGLETPEESPA